MACQDRLFAGEFLPALDRYVDIGRIDLHPEAGPAGSLRRDDSCPGSQERVVDCLARICVIDDRPRHAFDGLLRAVLGLGFLGLGANLPQGSLRAIPVPMPGLAFPDRIPARFVLPVIVAAADSEFWLGPDDLAADFEAAI
jgi:hypothetical protein